MTKIGPSHFSFFRRHFDVDGLTRIYGVSRSEISIACSIFNPRLFANNLREYFPFVKSHQFRRFFVTFRSSVVGCKPSVASSCFGRIIAIAAVSRNIDDFACNYLRSQKMNQNQRNISLRTRQLLTIPQRQKTRQGKRKSCFSTQEYCLFFSSTSSCSCHHNLLNMTAQPSASLQVERTLGVLFNIH